MSVSQITVTFISAPPSTTATVTIPIPAALQSLDSTQTQSTGFDAFDTLLSGIVRRGGVTFTDSSGVTNFIPFPQIVKIIGA